jgi:hypothetical protein
LTAFREQPARHSLHTEGLLNHTRLDDCSFFASAIVVAATGSAHKHISTKSAKEPRKTHAVRQGGV